jgi:hypothetical protein
MLSNIGECRMFHIIVIEGSWLGGAIVVKPRVAAS